MSRFSQLQQSVEQKEGYSPAAAAAVAAKAGRAKYGKTKFQAMSAAGRKRAQAKAKGY